MQNLCDYIEEHISNLIREAKEGVVEIQRNTLASRIGCAPSQINYVLETRFTPERGYLVSSKRGGGGFVRIIRVKLDDRRADCRRLIEGIGDRIPQESAVHYIEYLREEKVISDREALIMKTAVDRDTLGIPLPLRDSVRARLLKAMILAALVEPKEADRDVMPGVR